MSHRVLPTPAQWRELTALARKHGTPLPLVRTTGGAYQQILQYRRGQTSAMSGDPATGQREPTQDA